MGLLTEVLDAANTRITELEAENDELKTFINYSNAPPKEPTREQIAALVKPLNWYDHEMPEYLHALSKFYSYTAFLEKDGVLLRIVSSASYNDRVHCADMTEARAAAEAHHRETVLNLLNLPA